MCTHDLRRQSCTLIMLNTKVITSWQYTMSNNKKKSMNWDAKKNINNQQMHSQKNKNFTSKRKEISSRSSWTWIGMAQELLSLKRSLDTWCSKTVWKKRRRCNWQMKLSLTLTRMAMARYPFLNFLTNILKLLRLLGIDKLSAKIKCWNLTSNTNMWKNYWKKRSNNLLMHHFKNNAWCKSSKLEIFQTASPDHSVNYF